MSEATRLSFRTSDGLALAADAWGDAEAPAVLLQHGGGQTRHSWKGAAQALAGRGFRAISLDLRGHGDSDWCPRTDYTFTRFASDTLEVAAQIGRPVALVGASLGGIASLVATHSVGQTEGPGFSALVLVDVTPTMNADGAAAITGFMAERVDEGFATLEEAADAIATYLPHRPRPKNLDGLRKNLRQREDGRWRWHWDPKFVMGARPPGSVFDPDALKNAARSLSIPSLLVRGQMSELVDEEHAQEFLELAPHARYVDVSGASHMVAGDRNDAFNDAVAEFLGGLSDEMGELGGLGELDGPAEPRA